MCMSPIVFNRSSKGILRAQILHIPTFLSKNLHLDLHASTANHNLTQSSIFAQQNNTVRSQHLLGSTCKYKQPQLEPNCQCSLKRTRRCAPNIYKYLICYKQLYIQNERTRHRLACPESRLSLRKTKTNRQTRIKAIESCLYYMSIYTYIYLSVESTSLHFSIQKFGSLCRHAYQSTSVSVSPSVSTYIHVFTPIVLYCRRFGTCPPSSSSICCRGCAAQNR